MGTLAWFGVRWDAPAFDDAPQVPVPLGAECLGGCGELIDEGDTGITMPCVTADLGVQRGAYHLECHLRSVVGSVAHLEHRCSCYGGTEEGGFSRAEARAVMEWLIRNRNRS